MADRLRIRKVTVLPDRLKVTVEVDPDVRITNASVAQACLAVYPDLAVHTCKNNRGPCFGDVINHTSVPHLLEHLAISLMVRRDSQPFDYLGTTSWLPEENTAEVQLRFRNDVLALGAVKDAALFLNEVLGKHS